MKGFGKVVTPLTYHKHHATDDGVFLVGEVNTKPSLSIPGQTLSLEELIRRYTRGQSVETFAPVYHGDDDLIPVNWERMSEMERLDLSREIKGHLDDARRAIRSQAKQKQLPDQEPTSGKPDPEPRSE